MAHRDDERGREHADDEITTTAGELDCAELVSYCGLTVPVMFTLKSSGCAESSTIALSTCTGTTTIAATRTSRANRARYSATAAVEDLADPPRPQLRHHGATLRIA